MVTGENEPYAPAGFTNAQSRSAGASARDASTAFISCASTANSGRMSPSANRGAPGAVRVEYSLTDAGHSLRAPLKALEEWAIAHLCGVLDSQEQYDSIR